MAFKKERMEKILEREISNIIFQEVKNEKIKFVTITKASLTNDFINIFQNIDKTYIKSLIEYKEIYKDLLIED